MKANKGFTLLEAVITLGLWLILSSGIFLIWQHSAQSSIRMMERQSAFENARISMDALKMNFQLSRCIGITKNNYVVNIITLNQRQPWGGGWRWHDYRFRFNATVSQLQAGQPNTWNEFASDIALIELSYNAARLHIKITTTCEDSQILEGSVCARNKCIRINNLRRNSNPCPQGIH